MLMASGRGSFFNASDSQTALYFGTVQHVFAVHEFVKQRFICRLKCPSQITILVIKRHVLLPINFLSSHFTFSSEFQSLETILGLVCDLSLIFIVFDNFREGRVNDLVCLYVYLRRQ